MRDGVDNYEVVCSVDWDSVPLVLEKVPAAKTSGFTDDFSDIPH